MKPSHKTDNVSGLFAEWHSEFIRFIKLITVKGVGFAFLVQIKVADGSRKSKEQLYFLSLILTLYYWAWL